MQHRPKYAFISILLAAILTLEPALSAMSLQQVFAPWLGVAKTQSVYAQQNDTNIYLPIVSAGGTAAPTPTPTRTPTSAPVFEIMTPVEGSHIGGTTFFAIQSLTAQTITSVSFKAGNTDLGTDSSAADGFRVFVDAKTLPAGSLQFSATANGPGGSTTKTVTVNVVPNPPTSATIGGAGGVLASEIGSVISIRPGSAPEGTTITIDELTQAETTARHGIDWERMGVTFLGAQDVQSSAPISGPFGMVSSAGFGNRVQPGQAVVNYRLAPDADGDGVDEIVVINTASVAPNGDVVADPIQRVTLYGATVQRVQQAFNYTSQQQAEVELSGPPGSVITVETDGLNPVFSQSNLAIFKSAVNNAEVQVPLIAETDGGSPNSARKFSTIIPLLPVGTATLRVQNLSTGFVSDPISVTVEASKDLSKPAVETIDRALALASDGFNELLKRSQDNNQQDDIDKLRTVIAETNQIRNLVQQISISPTGEENKILNNWATLLENSGVLENSVHASAPSFIPAVFIAVRIVQVSVTVVRTAGAASRLNAIRDWAGFGMGLAGFLCGFKIGLCEDPTPTPIMVPNN